MKGLSTRPSWPPLISADRLPWPVRLRDMALTAGIWLLLGYMMRDVIALAIDYLTYPLFTLTVAEAPDWAALGRRMAPFAIISAVLVAWLMLWGLIRRKRLQQSAYQAPPPALDPQLQAHAFGIDPGKLAQWHSSRHLIVEFDVDGRITRARDGREFPASSLAAPAPPH